MFIKLSTNTDINNTKSYDKLYTVHFIIKKMLIDRQKKKFLFSTLLLSSN